MSKGGGAIGSSIIGIALYDSEDRCSSSSSLFLSAKLQ
jgi:hypothetical protein